jgi:hypothetical protein
MSTLPGVASHTAHHFRLLFIMNLRQWNGPLQCSRARVKLMSSRVFALLTCLLIATRVAVAVAGPENPGPVSSDGHGTVCTELENARFMPFHDGGKKVAKSREKRVGARFRKTAKNEPWSSDLPGSRK